MVKRVKDMTQKPVADVKTDGKAIAKTVSEITSVVKLSTDNEKASPRNERRQMYNMVCPLCELKVKPKDVTFYNIALLKKYMSVRGKIIPRSKTGLCSKHQRALAKAVKRARYLALLPYVDTGIAM